ncbi:MAG: class II aldolase/adducin family protein [Solirubrobacteraceae bacterium]
MLEREREHLAAVGRRLGEERLVLGGAGNLSMRAGDQVAISAAKASLATLDPADVVVVDLDGELLDGERPASSELKLHLGVYRRFGAEAVVHTHSPSAAALSCVLAEVPVVHYQMLLLGGPVRVAPYATFGSSKLAEVTVEALEGRTAALMANHGAIVHGTDLEVAFERARLLEWLCELYLRASVAGKPRVLTEEEQLAVVSAGSHRGYGAAR